MNEIIIECDFILSTLKDFNRIVKVLESEGWILAKKVIKGSFHQGYMFRKI